MLKKIGAILLICILAISCIAPFSILAEEADDPSYIAAHRFFVGYGLTMKESTGHYITCTTSGSTQSCSVSATVINDSTYWYNTMIVPAGSSFNRFTAYSTSNRVRVTYEPLYIVFLSTTNFTSANITAYPQSGYTVSATRLTNDYQTIETPSGYYLITLKIAATGSIPSQGYTFATIDLPGTSTTSIIPFFYGTADMMPDNIHRIVFGTGQTFNVFDTISHNYLSNINDKMGLNNTKLDTIHSDITSTNSKLDTIHTDITSTNSKLDTNNSLLQNLRNGQIGIIEILRGNSESSQAVSDASTTITNLNDSVSDLQSFDDDLHDQLLTDFQGIDITSGNNLITNNNFLMSANWVRTQYNRMIQNNAFASMISFSLVIGLSLLIIGKLRK